MLERMFIQLVNTLKVSLTVLWNRFSRKISEEMLTDIIKKYDTEDGNADGVIDVTIPDALILKAFQLYQMMKLLNKLKHLKKLVPINKLFLKKISLALRQLVDGKDTTSAIDKLTEIENQYNQR